MDNQTNDQTDDQQGNLEEIKQMVNSGDVDLAKGAYFWVYISPMNDTAKYVTDWSVKFEQQDGNWSGTVTSKDPQPNIQTPGLSGLFNLTVTAKYGPGLQPRAIKPKSGKAEIGCNSNCASMVAIVATQGGGDAYYTTTWDAFCNGGSGSGEE